MRRELYKLTVREQLGRFFLQTTPPTPKYHRLYSTYGTKIRWHTYCVIQTVTGTLTQFCLLGEIDMMLLTGWGQATKFWWSLMWRMILLSIPLLILKIYIPTEASATSVTEISMMFAAVFTQIIAVRWALGNEKPANNERRKK